MNVKVFMMVKIGIDIWPKSTLDCSEFRGTGDIWSFVSFLRKISIFNDCGDWDEDWNISRFSPVLFKMIGYFQMWSCSLSLQQDVTWDLKTLVHENRLLHAESFHCSVQIVWKPPHVVWLTHSKSFASRPMAVRLELETPQRLCWPVRNDEQLDPCRPAFLFQNWTICSV
jgi:hypothetical protein